jgi:hypothetical protein
LPARFIQSVFSQDSRSLYFGLLFHHFEGNAIKPLVRRLSFKLKWEHGAQRPLSKTEYLSLVKTQIAFLIAFFFFLDASAQEVLLNLNPPTQAGLTTEYRYAEVLDHRVKKNAIGEVFERAGYKLPVRIRDLEQSARRFFVESINPQKSAEKNIQVRILELDLTEKFNSETSLYEGDMQLSLGFFLKGNFDPVHLMDYAGSIQYQRSSFRMDRVEAVVNKLLSNSIVYFDEWMRNQKLSNRALASSFRLKIIDDKPASTSEKVYYDRDKPLTWNNFTARPAASSRYNATIFASFSLEGISMMDSGAVAQTMSVNVYMTPKQSWVRTPSDYGLNHEQRHFDIVRIVADRLIHRLQNTEFSLDFYQARINEMYLDAYREMNRLQEFYETGTNHGLDQAAQANWNGWVDEALKGDWTRIDSLLKPQK